MTRSSVYLEEELQRLSNERQAHGPGGQRERASRVFASERVNLPQLHGQQEQQNGKRYGAQERGQQCIHDHVAASRGPGEEFRWSSVCVWDSGVPSRSFYRLASPWAAHYLLLPPIN